MSPVVPNLMCTYSGRISWVRSIESKLNEVMSLLKIQRYFNETNQMTVQPTIKFYNALSKDLVLYEVQQYKAWFDNVHYVFDMLSQPVIRRNSETNRLAVNFDITILNTIEESKKMVKLHIGACHLLTIVSSLYCFSIIKFQYIYFFSIFIDIPELGQALINYETDLRRKLGSLNGLIELNNQIRLSIPIVFVNIFRPQLQKIDKAFKPGLSQIQWLSKDFDAYIGQVEKVLVFPI